MNSKTEPVSKPKPKSRAKPKAAEVAKPEVEVVAEVAALVAEVKAPEVEATVENNACSLEQLIAEEAYFIAERRGFAPENDLDDWLQAEATVRERLGCAQ